MKVDRVRRSPTGTAKGCRPQWKLLHLSPLRVCVAEMLSRVRLFATPWTVAHQAPLSMGFCRQDHWSGLPFPSPWGLPGPGMKPTSLMSPALAGGFFTSSAAGEAPLSFTLSLLEISALLPQVHPNCPRQCPLLKLN